MQHFTSVDAAVQWLRACGTGTLRSDSRHVEPGDVFLAWPGGVNDARQYLNAALLQGAAACLIEHHEAQKFDLGDPRVASFADLKAATGQIAAEFFGRPSESLSMVAVTGTNGKTSTAWWLAQALSALPEQGLPCGVVGTLGVGQPPQAGSATGALDANMVSTGFTTPDPVRFQQALRQFVDAGLKACALEASSIGLVEHRLAGSRLKTAIFTNLTQDHLDYHGSMRAYWEAKCQLFEWPGLEHAVINIDDPLGRELAHTLNARGLDVWTTGIEQTARITARAIAYTSPGLGFEVHEGTQCCAMTTQLIGTYNVANLLGVLGAMRSLGVPLPDAVAVCGTLMPVPGRMECIVKAGLPLVAVDYAHTPDALGKALDALRPLANQRGGRLWCIFGCGGDRDNTKRPMMGALAAQKADHVIVTSDNPRSEKPEAIIAQVLLGAPPCSALQVQSDRALAIAQAISQALANDVILIAGKGHEAVQEIAGVKTPFSDRAHAEIALQHRAVAVTGAQA